SPRILESATNPTSNVAPKCLNIVFDSIYPGDEEINAPLTTHFLKYLSNQSAIVGISLSKSGQPWPALFLTTSSAGTPACLSLAMMISACWIGTNLSASPWMISVGGSSAET